MSSSEILVPLYYNTWCGILEDCNLQRQEDKSTENGWLHMKVLTHTNYGRNICETWKISCNENRRNKIPRHQWRQEWNTGSYKEDLYQEDVRRMGKQRYMEEVMLK